MDTEGNLSGAEQYYSVIEKAINARGGIAGHPLTIVSCVDNNNANEATQCGQKAVSDPNMLAVIANGSTCSSNLLPILAKAKMASVADQLYCPEDLISPQVFGFDAAGLGDAGASVLGFEDFGLKNVAVTTGDSPAGHSFPPLVQALLGPRGGKVASVYIPLTAADMAPYAAQVIASGGFELNGTSVEQGALLSKALASQGYDKPVIYAPTLWDTHKIKVNIGNPTNAYIAAQFDLDSAGYRQFLADMSKYAPGVQYDSTDLTHTWLAANVVAQWAKSVSSPTAAALFSYLSTSTALNTFGMTIPLNFTKPGNVLGGKVPRLVNPCTVLYHYVNGQFVEVGHFTDVLDAPAQQVTCSG